MDEPGGGVGGPPSAPIPIAVDADVGSAPDDAPASPEIEVGAVRIVDGGVERRVEVAAGLLRRGPAGDRRKATIPIALDAAAFAGVLLGRTGARPRGRAAVASAADSGEAARR